MSQSAAWYMDVSGKIFSGIGAYTEPIFEKYIQDVGGLEDRDIFFAQVAYGFDPDPITPKLFYQRGPYGDPQITRQHMSESVERGWLQVAGDGQYTATEKSKDAVVGLIALADKSFASLEKLPKADIERILALLTKVVDKAKALPEPIAEWAFMWGERLDRVPSTPLMTQIRRRMIDLSSYRENVHIVAWQPYDVEGHVWETLTLVWRNEANTAAELAKSVGGYRGYDEEIYAAALEELVSRGWLVAENGKYITTEQGAQVRQEAEDATDRYFDAPWAALDEAGTKELQGLLEKLAQAVKPSEEETSQE